jgi:hypothetical protein
MSERSPHSGLREQFIAVTDPLDMWLCIDGNYARPATRQETELLAALGSLEEQFESCRSEAEEIITLRDASVAKRTVWLTRWTEGGWSADLGHALSSAAASSQGGNSRTGIGRSAGPEDHPAGSAPAEMPK